VSDGVVCTAVRDFDGVADSEGALLGVPLELVVEEIPFAAWAYEKGTDGMISPADFLIAEVIDHMMYSLHLRAKRTSKAHFWEPFNVRRGALVALSALGFQFADVQATTVVPDFREEPLQRCCTKSAVTRNVGVVTGMDRL
jgi:hypothetical protein